MDDSQGSPPGAPVETTERTRVLIIDDHPLFRKGARQLLEMDGNARVVGEASSGAEGMALAEQLDPDLILLDLNMEPMDGIETLRRLRQADTRARVIMLTVSDHGNDLVAALRAGADGYLLKDMEPEDLLIQLQRALAGHLVLSRDLTEQLMRAVRREHEPTPIEQAGLTERELEILGLIAEGLSNKHIARRFGIAEGTVKVHVKHLLKKLNLRGRVEAAVWAVEQQRQQ